MAMNCLFGLFILFIIVQDAWQVGVELIHILSTLRVLKNIYLYINIWKFVESELRNKKRGFSKGSEIYHLAVV